MSITGREVIGHCGHDMLIADNRHPLDVCHVTLAAGEKHRKGEVLEESEDGKCHILGTMAASTDSKEEDTQKEGTAINKATVASYILAENVDAQDADTIAIAYNSGSFIRNALIVKEGYSLTEKDERELRIGGIYLSDAMVN